MRRYLQHLFALLCVVLTALGAYNVMSDTHELELLAQKSTPICATKCILTRLDRTPFSQGFQFTTPQGQTVAVHCSRAAFLVGEYTCQPR